MHSDGCPVPGKKPACQLENDTNLSAIPFTHMLVGQLMQRLGHALLDKKARARHQAGSSMLSKNLKGNLNDLAFARTE
jgi:hypothetical protein